MGAYIYVFSPRDVPGMNCFDLEKELESFFGSAAVDVEAGSDYAGFTLDYELEDGEDPDAWADRLKPFLEGIGVRPGTVFEVFVDNWKPGMEWRRVEVFGSDRRLTKQKRG